LVAPCTDLWRGYFGEWEIIEDKLYLTKITGHGQIRNEEKYNNSRLEQRKKVEDGIISPQENGNLLRILKEECMEDIELSLNTLFNSNDKVFADWFSGTIICPYGDLVHYIHMGYESIYENDLYIEVLNGLVIQTTTVDNRPPSGKELLINGIKNFFDSTMRQFKSLFFDEKDKDELPGAYGNFGFELTNPIPVRSYSDGYNYLNNLRTDSNNEIIYKITGTKYSQNINHSSIFSNGEQIAIFYICPYQARTSKKAPAGFRLVK